MRPSRLLQGLRLMMVLAPTLILMVCLFALASTARAGAQLVWTTADNGPGSLRQALNDAVPGDTIYFGGNLSGQIDSVEQHARHH